MADEQVVTLEAPVTTQQADPFGASWTENPTEVKLEAPAATNTDAPATTTTTEAPATVTKTEDEILDPKEWLKREFETDDVEVLKAERAELKKLKETGLTAAEIKFENDQSKQVHELLRAGKIDEVVEIYNTKKKIERALAAEVTASTAPDIIKLGMQLKYKDLTTDEIEYKYNKEFGLPKEPKKGEDELDEDFDVRKNDWQDKYNDRVKDIIIEAKLLRPEVESSNAKLILPELSKPEPTQYKPTQEELDKFNQTVADFTNKVDNDLKTLNELSVTFKDEAVEITSSYALSDVEKSQISAQLKKFAEENFNANAILADRWVNQDGTLNVSRMTRDLARLNADEKIDQKFAQDAATKRLVQYRKEVGNINVNGGKTPQQTFDPTKSGQVVSPFAQGAWSEKPPALINN
jgi:hypothetical protein